ncbi:hypothetical protein [Mycobacteroides immunogenum]|nr:hypothetical protein [Mycobacteroides immunogenum]KPG47288.1 hypothetical protein AN915_03795 [Mycobacteroides immunogenum]KPG47359.1 hypothetical protein AN915_04290 [Mycobacteroides immunogenum]KPG53371.1 hypothetical protein AN917_05860 [Mycobacteroides immunogenum]KPG55780.1 hypothetical protein AN916_08005 [Mycobacteroides immunogenum]KPG55847.1 hypothetical protein AN916_08470 [Mycobacteroides immunogenum]
MAEFVAAQAAVLMVPSIKGFHSKLKTALETVRQDFTVQVKAQTDKMLAEITAAKKAAEATPIDLRVKVHDKEYVKQITEIRHKYENLSSQFRKGLILNVAVTGAQFIPQLGVAVAALNESIVSLSQNVLLLPGAFSAAAASVSTLLLGTRGLKDAFKAYGDAQKSATEDGRRLRDAQRSLTDANRDYARSLKDSQRNLRDLNLEMKGARLSEAEARLNLREAQAEEANTAGKSALQRQRDNLNVQQSYQRLQEVLNRNNDLAQDAAEANAKGVRGADTVVAALERIKNAQEGVQDSSKGAQGIAQAMGNLSPNARSFVAAMQALRTSYGGLRADVQDRIFAGLDRDVVELAGKSLPMLKQGLGSIGTAWNRNIRTMLQSLGTGPNQSLIGRILGNTAQSQSQLSNAINPFLDAFLRLSSVGSTSLPRLANGFARLMDRFDAFVKRSESSGKLDEWINRAIDAAKNFGNSLINIGSIMNTFAEGFLKSGGKGFLQWFQESTKRLSDYLKTAEGQEKINKFFRDARDVLRQFSPMLSALPDLFRAARDGAGAWASLMLPFLNAAATLLKAHPGLVSSAVVAYIGFKTVSPIIRGVTAAFELLRPMVQGVAAAASAGAELFSKSGWVMIGRATAMRNSISGLAASVGPGGALAIGLTSLATVVLAKYIQQQERAAGAAQDHADALRSMKSALDEVTGAMDKEGLLRLGKELEDVNTSGGDGQKLEHTNALKLAENSGVGRGEYLNSFVNENGALRNKTLGELDKVVQDDLAASSFWARYGDKYQDVGISKELITRALNGDQGAISEFKDKLANNRVDFQIKGRDLFQIQNELGEKAHDASTAAGILRDRTNQGSQAQSDIRDTNKAVYGSSELNAQGLQTFGRFGSPRAFASGSGVDITVDRYPDAQFVKDIQANGGSVKATAGGGAQIHLNQDRAGLYTSIKPPVRRAGGGMMFGEGSGTSDSILARLSNGEFVTKAASVAKYGPGLFHALNAGKIDPESLPGFDGGGGPIVVSPNRPNPYIPNTSVAPGGASVSTPLPQDLVGGAPNTALNPPPAPAAGPKLESPINQEAVRGPDPNRHGGGSSALTGPLPGPDPSTIVPDVPSAPQVPVDTPSDLGLGAIQGLPDNIQPVNILAQIGEVLLGAVLSFFGIDPTYFNLGKQVIQGVTGRRKGVGGAADPQAQALLDGAPGAAALTAEQSGLVGLGYDSKGMQVNTIRAANAAKEAFPGIAKIGGFRDDPGFPDEHPAGKAADLMVGDDRETGDAVKSYMLGRAQEYGIDYVIWDQKMWYPDGRVTPMPDRGGPTANHKDHVHIHTNGGGYPQDVAKQLSGNAEAMSGKAEQSAYNPQGGAEQWRPRVHAAIDKYGAQYGIQNSKAWEDAIVRQIDTESHGNPGAVNNWDSNAKAGHPSKGLLQFIPSTFNANNVTGGDFMDPDAQIAAVLPYVSRKYGMNSVGGPNFIGEGHGYAGGGILRGAGTGTSDSMLARVSNGEFITRAASVAKYGPSLFHALNEGKIDPSALPGYADGDQVLIPGLPAPDPGPGQSTGPLPDAPPPADIPLAGPSVGPTTNVGAPTEGVQAPAPVTEANPTPDVNAPAVTEQATDNAVGEAVGGIGAALKGTGGGVNPGAQAPQGAKPDKDPRSVMGAAPKNLNHNNPGLQKGIEGAASAIGGALSTAISVAASAGSFGAAGPAGGAAGSLAAAGVQMGGQAVAGAANILSSLLVGTLTSGSTANPSGVPMLPQEQQKQAAGPKIVNNFNGGIHTSNLEQWKQQQDRREAQQAASYMGPPSR